MGLLIFSDLFPVFLTVLQFLLSYSYFLFKQFLFMNLTGVLIRPKQSFNF